MITRSKWIIILFPFLGICKKPSTSNTNRAIGCTDRTLCFDFDQHLCLPCDQNNQDGNNPTTKSSPKEPKIGSGKKPNWPPKIGGRDSLPPARRSLKNRVFPYPTEKDWTEDKNVAHNRNKIVSQEDKDYDGCLDCLPKKNRMSVMKMMSKEDKPEKLNRQESPRDCEAKQGQGGCYLFMHGKCLQCQEFQEFMSSFWFPVAIDRFRADKNNPNPELNQELPG